MLINAQRSEELRIAIIQGNNLENYQVDIAESGLTRHPARAVSSGCRIQGDSSRSPSRAQWVHGAKADLRQAGRRRTRLRLGRTTTSA